MRDFYIFLSVVALIVIGVWGFNFYKSKKREGIKEVAYKVYLYEKGKLPYEEVIKYAKGSPYYPYLQAIKGNYKEVEKHIEDVELKSLYGEKVAAELYEKGKLSEAEKRVKGINEERFNYPSALSLLAFIYEKRGKDKESLSIWAKLSKEFGGTYFGKLAEIKIKELKK